MVQPMALHTAQKSEQQDQPLEDEDKNAEELDGDSEDGENGEEGSEEEEEEEGEDEEELETEVDGNDKDDVYKSSEIEELEREHMDLHQQGAALLEKNLSIAQSANGNSGQSSKKHSSDPTNRYEEGDEEWLRISQMHKRIASFRDKSIDKWQRKTLVTVLLPSKANCKLLIRLGLMTELTCMPYKSCEMRLIKVLIGIGNANGEAQPEGDPELLDYFQFYQQLLKEFFEKIDPTSSVWLVLIVALRCSTLVLPPNPKKQGLMARFCTQWPLQTKKRNIVDRPASKSRKIRYHVHEKIVNFMAPQPMNLPSMALKLFENLFGLKTRKLTEA
ncbi:hypothetical protein SLEP1_g15227 [Rubroshorea leprosula]|uniref:Apoptosis-antagonizing transcription factor C-terminal domain-containing protein n=1 Tax=Rubroshorea leprosula TaxID=152421 RepID=A0AAV5IUG5_9ROSI|nr:hypothetical protein SLEP1_g15227 [Rubroshorea leprosula]